MAEMSDYPVINHDDSQEDLPRTARALPRLQFTDEHRRLRKSLSKLTAVQLELERRLGSASLEIWSTTVDNAAPFEAMEANACASGSHRGTGEFSIRSSNGWKTALSKFKTLRSPNGASRADLNDGDSSPVAASPSSRTRLEWEDEIGETLASVREDIKILWEDNIVQEVLARRKVRLEDMPGL